jgi:outer membrane protein
MQIIRINAFFFVACLLFSGVLKAQETWSLQKCIEYAKDNNITIKQANATVRTAMLAEQQAKASRLPNISGTISGGEQFGYTIDRSTNQFVNTGVGFNSLQLSAGAQIFGGGIIHHSIKQAQWDFKASEASAVQTFNDLALNIAAAYLNCLLTEEQLKNANRRVLQSKEQLKNTQKLIEAGTLPLADRYNVEAQIATDEQGAITAQNNVDLAYLNLKQLLQLEPDFDLRIERPQITPPADANPEGISLVPLYNTAANTQPSIKAAGFRLKSAEEGITIARSAYYPTVNVGFNLNSNYSTRFPDESRAVLKRTFLREAQLVNIAGQDVPVQFPTMTYFKQIRRNFGQSIFASVNIPLYQNGRVRLNVERAKLNLLNAQLQQTQAEQQLKSNIQTAIASARAAKKQLDAAQKSFAASELAFQNMEKRQAIGAVNALDLSTARNNMSIAENNLVVARYDYIFRLKILDFYEGKVLDLK